MDIEQLAKEVESELHFGLEGNGGFDLPSARLYGVVLSDEGINMALVGQNPDVYALLDNDESKVLGQAFDLMTIVTTGWAAPLNANGEVEGAPSQHAERRRVRLAIIANREFIASVLRFQDEPEDVVVDLGNATGTLADAIQDFLR